MNKGPTEIVYLDISSTGSELILRVMEHIEGRDEYFELQEEDNIRLDICEYMQGNALDSPEQIKKFLNQIKHNTECYPYVMLRQTLNDSYGYFSSGPNTFIPASAASLEHFIKFINRKEEYKIGKKNGYDYQMNSYLPGWFSWLRVDTTQPGVSAGIRGAISEQTKKCMP